MARVYIHWVRVSFSRSLFARCLGSLVAATLRRPCALFHLCRLEMRAAWPAWNGKKRAIDPQRARVLFELAIFSFNKTTPTIVQPIPMT